MPFEFEEIIEMGSAYIPCLQKEAALFVSFTGSILVTRGSLVWQNSHLKKMISSDTSLSKYTYIFNANKTTFLVQLSTLF
jgi:hypothetical protein